ncbi:MAG TPA: hypothetical protein VJ995_04370 [Geothermobacteraceae bacterium]|nr:hypothetical protein [Geothermobacteraceae bacterium]
MQTITVAFYKRLLVRQDWEYPIDEQQLALVVQELNTDLNRFNIQVHHVQDDVVAMEIRGYGDLLNSIRIRAPHAGFGNLCLSHIIGASPGRDLYADIKRGINRIAFAPETIEPEGSDKVVCHNCGCGC